MRENRYGIALRRHVKPAARVLGDRATSTATAPSTIPLRGATVAVVVQPARLPCECENLRAESTHRAILNIFPWDKLCPVIRESQRSRSSGLRLTRSTTVHWTNSRTASFSTACATAGIQPPSLISSGKADVKPFGALLGRLRGSMPKPVRAVDELHSGVGLGSGYRVESHAGVMTSAHHAQQNDEASAFDVTASAMLMRTGWFVTG